MSRSMPRETVSGSKTDFGQPLFKRVARDGQLQTFVGEILPLRFLFWLLCYDVWHNHFIEHKHAIDPRNRDQLAALGLATPQGRG